MGDHCLRDLPAELEHRIERGHRVLEDHPDPPAAQRSESGARRTQQLGSVEADGAGRHGVDVEKSEGCQNRLALSRPRLAHERGNLTALHVDDEATHRVYDAAAYGEANLEIADLHEWAGERIGHRFARTSSASRRPSPRKLNAMPTDKMARPGATAIHHW